MANAAADIFRQAAQLNRDDACRKGNIVHIEPGCEMLVSGDLHGFRAGMTKVIAAAGLDGHPQRRLVFQEIIHGPPEGTGGHDRSIDLLLRAARLKVTHGGQAVFLLGNHDVAQVTGNEITKQGRGVCKAFVAGVEFAYAEAAGEVLDAVKAFLLSMPIAARCPGRTFVAHSLPSPTRMAAAGMGILEHPYTDADLRRGGGAYEWTWGRDHTPAQLDAMSQALDVDYFILGHRHSKQGCEVISSRGLTINSDHEHGFVMRFAGDEPIVAEKLDSYLKPIMTLA